MKRDQRPREQNQQKKRFPQKRQQTPQQGYLLPVIVGIVAVLLFLALAFFFRTPNVGQVIETPQLQPLTLDLNASFEIDVRKVSTWKMSLRPSGELVEHLYQVEVNRQQPQHLQYQLQEVDSAGNRVGDVLGKGFLNDTLTAAGAIYANDDTVPDLSLSYANNIFRVINLNYVAPDVSNITLFIPANTAPGTTSSELSPQDLLESRRIVPVAKDQAATFLVEVSSSKTPVVRALWNGTTPLAASEWAELQVGAKRRLFRLSFTPAEERPYVIVIESTVDTQVTRKTFTFSVNNVIYHLTDTSYPEMIIKLADPVAGQGQVTFIAKGSSLQPFSFPCAQDIALPASFTATDNSGIAILYGYNAETQLPEQLKPGTPSEISNIRQQKGYALKIPGANPLQVQVTCPVQLASSALALPQALKGGWNLVAISGSTPVLLSELEQKAPPTKTITDIFELQNGGATLRLKVDGRVMGTANSDLDPGKAYWVYVQ